MPRQLHRPVLAVALAAALAATLALVPSLPAAAAAPDRAAPISTVLDRLADWLGSLGFTFVSPASEGEASPHMDPNGLTVPAPEEGQAQEDSGDSQDTMPHLDPNG